MPAHRKFASAADSRSQRVIGGAWVVAGVALLAACGGGGGGQMPTQTGSLVIEVSGLPQGAAPRLLVSGPGSEVRSLSAGGQLSGLAPGSYTISALHVPSGALDYLGAVAPGTVVLEENGSDTVQVTYTGGALATVNFRVAGIQLLQSVQNTANTVPMVANRAALLRVFALSNQAGVGPLKVRIHLYQNGVLVDSLNGSGPTLAPTTVDTGSLGSSWNAVIPGNRVISGLSFDAVVDPDDQLSESTETDNRFPAGASRFTPVVRTVAPFKLRLVPVHQQANGLQGNVSAANQTNYTDLARRIFPISQFSVDLRAVFTTSAPALMASDSNGGWSRILSEINALRATESADRTYYGVVTTSYNSGIAGLGYVGAPAAIGWDKGSGVGGVAAHELGHTFGRVHAPCGTTPFDQNYPYPGAVIGSWGYDQGTGTLKGPLDYVDLMSYCSPDWISDYNYDAVFDHLTGAASVQAPASVPGLLIWGRIIGDSLVLEPAFRVTAPARLPTASGPYRVTGTAADGSTAFDLRFAGDEVPDLPGPAERHFAFVVPMAAGRVAGLAAIRLRGPARLSVQASVAAGPAEVEVKRAAGDQIEVRWDARYPMAVVRDAASGEILAFARGGSATVIAPGAVKVELSRGPGSVAAVVRGRK